MKARRFLLVGMGLVLGIIAMVTFWPSRNQAGALSINFLGLTNDGSGSRLAQFTVRNTFPRRVRFGVGEIQLYQTNGWPGAMRVAGGAEWLSATSGGEREFSVPIPVIERANWRVPLIYEEALSFADNVRFRIGLLAWGIARWRPGGSFPVRNGDAFHRISYSYGPVIFGASPLAVQQASRSQHNTNASPEAVGSRR